MMPAAPRNLDVGLYVSPPFVEESGANTYSGMAIDLWESITQRMGLTFQYVGYPTLRDLVQATADGEVDVAGGMTVAGSIFHRDKYGFAFPHESELADQVTLVILDLQEDGTVKDIRLKYFGRND